MAIKSEGLSLTSDYLFSCLPTAAPSMLSIANAPAASPAKATTGADSDGFRSRRYHPHARL